MDSRTYARAKRAMDLLGAAALLTLLSPVFLLLACLTWSLQGRPIFFHQYRIGQFQKPFQVIKFRTMKNTSEEDEGSEKSTVTPLGRLLRKTSLDEIPQLKNILVGEMSFVGPRPLPLDYQLKFSERQLRRHSVRPGLTGLAQVEGRNSVAWERRLELDEKYVDTYSFLVDLRVVLRTVLLVIRAKDVQPEFRETMPDFRS